MSDVLSRDRPDREGPAIIVIAGGISMANIMIRNLDEETVEALKEAARCSGRSMQAEVRMILEAAVERRARDEAFWTRLDEIQRGQRPSEFDSTEIIREAREHGYSGYEW